MLFSAFLMLQAALGVFPMLMFIIFIQSWSAIETRSKRHVNIYYKTIHALHLCPSAGLHFRTPVDGKLATYIIYYHRKRMESNWFL